MKKLLTLVALAMFVAGCATKSRSIDVKGMFVSESGQLAIGYGHVDAIPEATDSAIIHYEEDVALLSPSTKTHDIDIILTGTNSVSSSEGIVKAICKAFVQVAPSVAAAKEVKGQLGSGSVGAASDSATGAAQSSTGNNATSDPHSGDDCTECVDPAATSNRP